MESSGEPGTLLLLGLRVGAKGSGDSFFIGEFKTRVRRRETRNKIMAKRSVIQRFLAKELRKGQVAWLFIQSCGRQCAYLSHLWNGALAIKV